MKLQQLRYLHEVYRRNLSISEAAASLHTSQPGVSKQIQLLEEELGIDIFIRSKNRLSGLTPGGRAIVEVAARILNDATNLKRIAEDFRNEDSGALTVVTTHTQARYALPKIVKRFVAEHPQVKLSLRQGTPNQIWRLVLDGSADIAIASEPKEPSAALAMMRCTELPRVVLTPPNHPLLKLRPLTLEALAEHPIITYDDEYIGHSKMLRAFAAKGLTVNLVLSATDSNVMKAYVESGLGVAIIAKMAYDPKHDRNLRMIDASRIFESNTLYLGFRRNFYLRRYALDFIQMVAPHLTPRVVKAALDGSAKFGG